MSLLSVIVVLIVIGIVLWLINTYLPLDANVKKIINIVAILFIVIWLLQVFGLLGALGSARIH